MILNEYLSIWEIAHRWKNTDPNKTDPQSLPFTIQDMLRHLCQLILSGKIGTYDQLFIYSENENTTPKSTVFSSPIHAAIEAAASSRKYNIDVLDNTLINRFELFHSSIMDNLDFPDFWHDDELVDFFGGVPTDQPLSALTKSEKINLSRTSHFDKSVCHAVAKTLWDIDPTINIAQMTRHPSIQKHAGGKNYKGKHTLRNWLKEVAPEHLKNKNGRPKSNASNDAT